MLSLSDAYQDVISTPSDIWEHLPTFVALVEELDAQTVIELGTRTGVSTIAWLYALEARGHLWSVDIDEQPQIGEHDHWTFLRGDDCTGDIYTQLPSKADIVFIDTSHAYTHTMAELSLYQWLVRPGGKIVLHDTEVPHPDFTSGRAYPVKRAIEDFCVAEGLTWTNQPNCNGLGIIDIPEV